MYLSRMHIENFRGIARLDIDFSDTTVLIGENASGKTSVLEALEICLGHRNHSVEFPFNAHDFNLATRGDEGDPPPIRIRLTFTEREDGEWDVHRKLRKAFLSWEGSLRQLKLEVRAATESGAVVTGCRFLDRNDRALTPQPDTSLVEALRQVSPFLLVRHDRYEQQRGPHASEPRRREPEREFEREVARLYDELIASDGLPQAKELRDRIDAMSKLIGDNAERIFDHPEAPELALHELVERPVVLSLGNGPSLSPGRHGAGTGSVALLLLLGAVLEARGPMALAPGAEMILAVEEPELHLHPIMLTAMWSVIESLRGQKMVTSNSGELLAAARLGMIRRLVRRADHTAVYQLDAEALTLDEMRKVTYHVRLKRDDALFARAWLLVEGETEVWLLPEIARTMGIDFASEGIRCVEFAQSGVEPTVKLANGLGIKWHLLADGDVAGQTFAEAAERHLDGASYADRITLLSQPDIEHSLWDSGYAYVYHSIARGRSHVSPTTGRKSRKDPSRVIEMAIRNSSKPFLALTVVEQANEEGSPGIPSVLQGAINKTLRLARSAAPTTQSRTS